MAVNTLESERTTTETSTTMKTLSKAPKAALMMLMMFVGVFSVVALFNERMINVLFPEGNIGIRVVMLGTTAIAMTLGSAFVFYEKRKRRICTRDDARGRRKREENAET